MVKKKGFEDTTLSIGTGMSLTVKEVRGSSTLYSRKEGYEEVSRNTKTRFHWKLGGVAAKLSADVVASETFDPKAQEVYRIEITSSAYDVGCIEGFKSRDDAIRNAVEFARRNGVEIDGYTHAP